MRKLGRPTSHRRATLRALLVALFRHGQIRTTAARAREVVPLAESLLTQARQKSPEAMRRVRAWVPDAAVLQKLFDEIGPRLANQNGGRVRIYRIGRRKGDAAPLALLRLG